MPFRARQTVATLAAFAIAPLVAAAGVLLMGTVGSGVDDPMLAAALFLIYLLWAIAFETVLALPTFLLLLRFGLVRWFSATLVGLVVGIVAFAIMNPQGLSATLSNPRECASWASVGGLSAFVFWLTWRLGQRPLVR